LFSIGLSQSHDSRQGFDGLNRVNLVFFLSILTFNIIFIGD
jgi:hypothetical protein